jgi:short-subunit dehydrogenase
MKIKGKTIIVTGGGSGMGREMVLKLLNLGANVAAIDMNEVSLNETVTLSGASAERLSTHTVDISDAAAVQVAVEKIAETHGHIDGLINNAGIIQPFVRIKDLEMSAIEKVMHVNFYGTLYMKRAVLPFLMQRPEAQIVNISSMGGFLPVPGQAVYGASKAAVKLLTEALYAELLDTPIHVTLVFPGAVATNITQNSGVSIPGAENRDPSKSKFKAMTASQAAVIIISGMENNATRIYVGKDSKMMNLLYRISPGFATRFIAKQMKSLLT